MRKSKVTINDVAKKANVSKVTVSYILNKRDTPVRISEETKQRVWAAVQELGYYPNAVARALARRLTETIAIVLQFPSVFMGWSGFTNELMHGATDKAIELGYDLMLHTKAQKSIEEELRTLLDGRVDGALLLRDLDDPLLNLLADQGFPHVLFFTKSLREDVYWVDCDNVLGGKIATEHLIRLGHTRIAHLSGPPKSSNAIDRLLGYQDTMHEFGLQVRPEWIIQINYGGDDFTPVANLLQSKDRPTGFFAWSDEVAIQAMRVCRQLGLKVPEDVAIVGFDSTPICEHTDPPLTSVRQPIYEMAATALEILVKLIQGERLAKHRYIFTPSLDIRTSCGALLSMEGL